MIGDRRWTLSVAALAALAAGAGVVSPPLDILRGLSLDGLTAIRWTLTGERRESNASPTVVIALDEETARTPPFKGTPAITWTNEIGRVITAVLDGGASVVGFDVIFPTSIEESEIPLAGETIGAKVRGFDRDYLRALAAAAKTGKIVLGEIQIGDDLVLPSAGQRVAVGQQRNIRSLDVYADQDDVVRRVPLTLTSQSGDLPAMALELASRKLGETPQIAANRSVSVAGYEIPSNGPNGMTLNFDGGAGDIPTYSLADLHACLDKDDKEFFRRNFAGKVVLLGSTLDTADLKLTSKRFTAARGGREADRCTPKPVMAPPTVRAAINGVYVHATAVNNIVDREALTELSALPRWLISLGGASLGACAALLLTPVGIAASFLLSALAWIAVAVAAFASAIAVPLFEPLLAGLMALVATAGYRLYAVERDKRILRSNFGLYLSPAVIEKMLNSPSPPALGGELREISALFFDLVGYSSIAERLAPVELVALMNRYLSAMTEIIEAHGGFVDKYVGDAIVAIFGAPAGPGDHATAAVRAALACCAALESLNAAKTSGNAKLAHRVGLNSGEALVGNIGSKRRFNYTAIGDSVNIAARLEGANRYFGTTILASQATMTLTGDAFAWREVDMVKVKGRVQPIVVFEPLALRGHESARQRTFAAAYAEGLAHWREGNFAAAMTAFARCADNDPPSASFLTRAEKLHLRPPPDHWEPIYSLE